MTSFRGWRHPLDAPHVWTPLFFLDEAVALAAGHRPCAFCRRDDYRSYRDAVGRGGRRPRWPPSSIAGSPASGSGAGGRLDRAADRLLWTADIDTLPDGTVVLDGQRASLLVGARRVQPFTFDGWAAAPRPRAAHVPC